MINYINFLNVDSFFSLAREKKWKRFMMNYSSYEFKDIIYGNTEKGLEVYFDCSDNFELSSVSDTFWYNKPEEIKNIIIKDS